MVFVIEGTSTTAVHPVMRSDQSPMAPSLACKTGRDAVVFVKNCDGAPQQ